MGQETQKMKGERHATEEGRRREEGVFRREERSEKEASIKSKRKEKRRRSEKETSIKRKEGSEEEE